MRAVVACALLLWSASLPLGRSAPAFAQGYGGSTVARSASEGGSLSGERVRLETTKGAIVIAVHRDWAPRGADRFLELVKAGYFDDSRFFRVVKGQWAQFGINKDPKVSTAWRQQTIPDDPRGQSLARG